MDSILHFRINGPQVVHETIDGETVIINLENGHYYSLQHVGADIWNLIDQGARIGQITERISQKYNGSPDVIEHGVNQLLTELQQQQLISPMPVEEGQPQPSLEEVESAAEKHEFIPPVLERFTDMQDLLLLDPIHEADEAEGWPKQRQEETE